MATTDVPPRASTTAPISRSSATSSASTGGCTSSARSPRPSPTSRPATGIFTLFILGVGTLGGAFIWTWPVVALGQFIVALNFAEVSSHFPIAGSVFQWTKYLAARRRTPGSRAGSTCGRAR